MDAVGGHQDSAGECRKIFGLILPGCPVMTNQMGKFFQAGVSVTGKHLSVSVDIYSLTFRLFQYFFQVFQIMTGYQNGFPFFRPEGNISWHRVAIGTCITCIE